MINRAGRVLWGFSQSFAGDCRDGTKVLVLRYCTFPSATPSAASREEACSDGDYHEAKQTPIIGLASDAVGE